MTEKLKKCPICGKIDTLFVGTDKELEWKKEDEYSSGYFAVCCNFQHGGCGTSGGYRKTEEEAVELWNTRAEDENPVLTLDELQQMTREPVWIESKRFTGWAIILKTIGLTTDYVQADGKVKFRHANGYRKTWLGYRRKPEGEEI